MASESPRPVTPPSPPSLKPTWLSAGPPVPVVPPAPAASAENGIEFLCRRVSEMEKRLATLAGMEERLLARLDKGFTALSQELGKAKRAVTEDASPRPAPVIPKLAQPAPWPTAAPGGVPADVEPPIMRTHGGTDGSVVLLVDDDAMVRRITSVMLQKAGYLVDTANSGNAALDAIAETPGRYGAIMLDLSMPGLTGEQTYRRMLDQKIGIPVLFYSGYSYQLAELFAKYGGSRTEFLLKPFEPGQLTERIARLLPVPARRILAGQNPPAAPGTTPLPPVSGLPPMASQAPAAAVPAPGLPAVKPKTAPTLPRLPEIGNARAPSAPAATAEPPVPDPAAEPAPATAEKSPPPTPVAALQPIVPADVVAPSETAVPASDLPAATPEPKPAPAAAVSAEPKPAPAADSPEANPVPATGASPEPEPAPDSPLSAEPETTPPPAPAPTPTPRSDEIAAEPFRGVENLPSVKTRPSPFARVSTRPLPAPEEVALASTDE